MGLTTAVVIALTYDPPRVHDDGTDDGIGGKYSPYRGPPDQVHGAYSAHHLSSVFVIFAYMDTIRSFEQEALECLTALYEPSEAREIARQLLEEVRGCTRTQLLLLSKDTLLSPAECARLERMLHDLSAGTPLQYVLGYAYFAGHRLTVAPGVLIPRPETEELIELILQHPESRASQRLLDVGTGSGCIAYALTAALPKVSQSVALEVSSEAAPIAEANFEALRKATGAKSICGSTTSLRSLRNTLPRRLRWISS